MEIITEIWNFFLQFISFFLHLDVHLDTAVQNYGNLVYGILFLIIFCETGLVVTPFLPGDSLLFAVGALAARDILDWKLLTALLIVSAILGDATNYAIGKRFGAYLLSKNYRFLNPVYLEKTHAFYEKYGSKTIVIARFVPIVRTFAPFLAGMGKMSYKTFGFYNIFGGILWVAICLAAGYFFGNFEIVKKNFSLVIFGIIGVSLMPAVVELILEYRKVRMLNGDKR